VRDLKERGWSVGGEGKGGGDARGRKPVWGGGGKKINPRGERTRHHKKRGSNPSTQGGLFPLFIGGSSVIRPEELWDCKKEKEPPVVGGSGFAEGLGRWGKSEHL